MMAKQAVSRQAMPKRVRPMLARPSRLPNDDHGEGGSGRWAFEVKWDGVRAIAYCTGGTLRLESRNLNDITGRYPELEALGERLEGHRAVLDGEIVALDECGTPSFGLLQARMHLESQRQVQRLVRERPVTYVVFDVLYLDGQLTMPLPYRRRRELLAGLELEGEHWQTPAYRAGHGRDLLRVTAEHGLEGVVAKLLASPYRPGERSGDWLKVKNTARQELVVAGWLPGKGRRSGEVGALLLGYYERRNRRRVLRYAGRVGTGFDEPELRRLGGELGVRAVKRSPFSKEGVQPPPGARFAAPELVAEVEFTAWTRDGVLRHPSYKGLRSDKPAQEVERETVEPAPEAPAGQGSPYEVVHATKRYTDVRVQGRALRLSNREKVLYPRTGFAKKDLIDYYAAVAPVLLPHLRRRPLTLKRYPDGVQGEFFYEKRCPSHRPEWVHTVPLWSERNKRDVPYCVVEDLPTLMWTANLADIELHTSLSLASRIERPTMLVFDLDPGPPAGFRECARVALLIRELFDAFHLRTLVKTSGAKGLQVYVPLNTPTSYEHTKPFARAVAELLEKQHPKQVVSRMAKSLRKDRVLIDWSQNHRHKTTVCVYSLRATERPFVSTPLDWEEVERAARRRVERPLSAEPHELLERVRRDGDLFEPLLHVKQRLPELPV